MNRRKLEEKLKQLNKHELLIFFAIVFFYWTRHKISNLQLRQIVIPISILQIITFAALVSSSLIYAAIGNMVIVGIAFIPYALKNKTNN